MAFYHGPVSDHFDGEHFYNSPNGMPHGGGSVVKWLANREPGPWPKWIDAAPGPPPPERVSDGGLRATFVGHSTVLIQMDGVNILVRSDLVAAGEPTFVDWAAAASRAGHSFRAASSD